MKDQQGTSVRSNVSGPASMLRAVVLVYSYFNRIDLSRSFRLLPTTLGPVRQELRLALVRQRMIEKLIYNLKRYGCDVGTQTCRFDHVNRVSQARGQHFRLPRIVLIDLDNALEQIQS